MAEIPELRTSRLQLREWKPADLAPFAALNADPEVMEYFPALIGEARPRLVLRPPLPDTPPGDRFGEHRIGLDHVAIGVLPGPNLTTSPGRSGTPVFTQISIMTRSAPR